MAEPTAVIYARVPRRLHERVVTIAGASEVSISDLVALVLQDFLDHYGPADRVELVVRRETPETTA